MIYGVTHRGCLDGLGANYAMWRVWGDSAIYIPVNYGDNHKDTTIFFEPGDEIYIADFCFPLEVYEDFITNVLTCWVMDHHKTAEPIMHDLSLTHSRANCIYDVNRSGAMIAWQTFHDCEWEEGAPMVIRHVQDRDLWRFALPDTKACTEGLWAYAGFDMSMWSLFCTSETAYKDLIVKGNILLDAKAKMVDRLSKLAVLRTVAGYPDIPTINTALYTSETCHALLEKFPQAPFVAYWYEDIAGRRWGLRSRPDETDVSVIAKSQGGGGHAQAAGFGERL